MKGQALRRLRRCIGQLVGAATLQGTVQGAGLVKHFRHECPRRHVASMNSSVAYFYEEVLVRRALAICSIKPAFACHNDTFVVSRKAGFATLLNEPKHKIRYFLDFSAK